MIFIIIKELNGNSEFPFILFDSIIPVWNTSLKEIKSKKSKLQGTEHFWRKSNLTVDCSTFKNIIYPPFPPIYSLTRLALPKKNLTFDIH